MEDVLKLLAAGADVTPFTFPASLLGAAAAPGLGPTNLDLALAIQAGTFPSFLMGSLGSGGAAPLPLPQALALPSLELPKLLSLDVGIEGAQGPNARGTTADNGNNSDPSGSGGSAPRSARAAARQLQQMQQQQQQQQQLQQQFEAALPPRQASGSMKREPEPSAPAAGRNKRQATAPESRAEAREVKTAEQRQAAAAASAAAAAAAAAAAEAEAEARLELHIRKPDLKHMGLDGSNSDGSDTTSESAGAAAPRSGPARGARRTTANKDPVARAQMRQLKKRDLNREAQRRFRDRQKAALALLESTTQSQQREIEALRLTNKLLEEQYRALLDQHKALQLRFVTLQMKTQSK